MKNVLFLLSLFFTSLCGMAQNNVGNLPDSVLTMKLEKIITHKKADIGVSLLNLETGETVSIRGRKPYPLISVFKFHVALTVMHQIDEGKLQLDQQLFIKNSELLKDTYSPFRDKYPKGNLYITLQEALEWMIKVSDNNLCDILIKLVGGVNVIQSFIDSPYFVIKNDEAGMHESWDAQFLNTSTPDFATALLQRFYQQRLLSPGATAFLYKTMVATSVGEGRIKGLLPSGTVVAHRIGSSFTNDQGLTGAVNDIGIIEMPNGQHLILSVFVHNTTEQYKEAEAIIARIAKVAWDYYTNNR